jgi:hypothetical protein
MTADRGKGVDWEEGGACCDVGEPGSLIDPIVLIPIGLLVPVKFTRTASSA